MKSKTGSSVARASRRPATADLPVQRVQPSYVQVASQLRALILSGKLSPGERLPTEGDLAAQFGVSRSTTREALRLLAAEGLVETRRGVTGGAFIVHPDPADLELALSTAVNLAAGTDRLSMAEVFEMWEITQVPAAVLAARRRTDEEAERMLELSGPWKGTRQRMPELVLSSIEFHNMVLDAAKNRLLRIYARPLNGIGAESLKDDADTYEFVVEGNARHHQIAEAIAAQDEDAAGRLMGDDMSRPAIFHHIPLGETLTR
jgi:GntR family transcriptional regulator, transcriptional repressor for pyruvate dehydrogenase complex